MKKLLLVLITILFFNIMYTYTGNTDFPNPFETRNKRFQITGSSGATGSLWSNQISGPSAYPIGYGQPGTPWGPTGPTVATMPVNQPGYVAPYIAPYIAPTGGGVPNPTPVPTPTQPSGGVNVGDKRSGGPTGTEKWTGNEWVPEYGAGGGQLAYDPSQQIRSDIEGEYNDYFAQLDEMMNTSLPAQQTAMQGIATSQGTQAETTLGGQRTQGLADLATQTRQTEAGQAKTLQNLAEDIRNQFKAGQIYLGARGAGDSSAANQYSYAIAKMGSQARGSVLQQTTEIRNQIADKEFRLNNTYNTELNNIKEQVNQKILEIANWFSQSQQQIQTMKAQGQLQKGTDLVSLSRQLLQNATQKMLMIQQESANKRSMLDQWAMNNSTTINQLKTNIAAIGSYQSPGINQPNISGQLQTGAGGEANYVPTGYGFRNTAGQGWTDKTKYPVGSFTGDDGKTYTRYSDGTSGPTQWTWG